MIRTADSVYVHAPVDKVYKYCADPEKWTELAPPWGHMEITNIKKVRGLTGSTWDSTGQWLRLPPMKESFEVIDAEPNRRLVLSGDGTMGKETATFLFDSVNGGTVVTMVDEREQVAVERVPIVGRLAKGVINWSGTLWMYRLRARMEARGSARAAKAG